MFQHKSYKLRIYPGKMSIDIDRNFGCTRFVTNQFVADFKNRGDKTFVGPHQTLTDVILKNRFPWLREASSTALQQARRSFEETKRQYFSKTRKKKLSSINFKKRGVRDSFNLTSEMFKLDQEKCLIKLQKIKSFKIKIDTEVTGKLISVTISKNSAGQYFASILTEQDIKLKPYTGKSIGIDLGLSTLMTLSNGMKISNLKLFRENQAKLKRAQQHLSRKQKGSNRRVKAKLKVARIHLDIRNQRSYLYHNLSTWLVTEFDNIFMEDLNVAGMKKLWGKSVSDAAFSTLVNMIDYKCKWYGKTFHKVNRFFPSSKLCSDCGWKKTDLTLADRSWKCESCGSVHDRDLNASFNILQQGVSDTFEKTSAESVEYRRGEAVRPRAVLPKASSVKRLFNYC